MAHALDPVSAPTRSVNVDLTAPEIVQARLDLAATFRAAARHGLAEGICNHFSAMVPGSDDLFLVNPYGRAFEEITPASLLVCTLDGTVVAGDGTPEATAFFIHARVHAAHPRARVVLHTHMPYATALTMVDGPPLAFAGQTALKFLGRLAVDDTYGGLALDRDEGDRIAATLGTADVVFMRNHGVMVCAPTIAEAWDDLYYLERACQAQVIAESTGRTLRPVPPDIARRTAEQMRQSEDGSARLHLDSIQRGLDRDCPGWRG